MAIRFSILVLVLAVVVHLLGLWPLPNEMAQQRLAFWAKMKSDADAIDPSKSDHPRFDAQIKERMLGDIDKVLADPEQVLAQARFEWALYLAAAAFTAGAAVAVVRRWKYWPWMTFGSVVMYFWLYRPFAPLKLFYAQDRLDFASGVTQLKLISEYPNIFWPMVCVSVVATLLILVLLYGVIHAYCQRSIRGAANAP